MDSFNDNDNNELTNNENEVSSEIFESDSNATDTSEYLSVTSLNKSNSDNNGRLPKENRFLVSGMLYSFLMVFCLSFISFTFIFNYLLMPIQVVGVSMRPTLNSSNYNKGDQDETHCDIVYISKDNLYNNNDIAVISNEQQQYVSDSATLLIKRIIATPGQTVVFKLTNTEVNHSIFLGIETTYTYTVSVLDENGNDIGLDQSYLDEDMIFSDSQCSYEIFRNIRDNGEYRILVPENCYFAMGDNRNNSFDSRYFGVVKYDDILGSVKLIVPYNHSLISSILEKIKSELLSFATA